MRFAQKFSTDGPHAPIGYEAPKKLFQEIERRLNIVKEIRCEPLLINNDNQFACQGNIDTYKHIHRMKAIDLLKDLEDELVRACGNDESMRRHPGQDLRIYLLDLRKEGMPLTMCESKLINEFVECYTNARSDPIPDFGSEEFSKYTALLNRIKTAIVPRSAQSKANSPLNANKRNKINKAGNSSQTFTLKSLSSSPTKASSFQTQIVQDDSIKKDSETCV